MKHQKHLAEEADTEQNLNRRKIKAISLDSDEVAGASLCELQDGVFLAIFRIREIVKLFKFSPVKNPLLQQEQEKKPCRSC